MLAEENSVQQNIQLNVNTDLNKINCHLNFFASDVTFRMTAPANKLIFVRYACHPLVLSPFLLSTVLHGPSHSFTARCQSLSTLSVPCDVARLPLPGGE